MGRVVVRYVGMGKKPTLPTKHLNKYQQGKAKDLMPDSVVQELANGGDIKDYVAEVEPVARQRICAFISTFMSVSKTAESCGVSTDMVRKSVQLHQDIVQSATLSRNIAIAGLAEQKAIELLSGMNTNEIDHAKKPQAIKYLVDSADIANQHLVSKKEQQPEDTMELVFRIRKRMTQPVQAVDDIIDVQEVKPEPPKELTQ